MRRALKRASRALAARRASLQSRCLIRCLNGWSSTGFTFSVREACLTRRDSAEKCARRMRPGPWPRGCAFGAGVSCLYLRRLDLANIKTFDHCIDHIVSTDDRVRSPVTRPAARRPGAAPRSLASCFACPCAYRCTDYCVCTAYRIYGYAVRCTHRGIYNLEY